MLRLLYLLWEWDINTILIKFSEDGYVFQEVSTVCPSAVNRKLYNILINYMFISYQYSR